MASYLSSTPASAKWSAYLEYHVSTISKNLGSGRHKEEGDGGFDGAATEKDLVDKS